MDPRHEVFARVMDALKSVRMRHRLVVALAVVRRLGTERCRHEVFARVMGALKSVRMRYRLVVALAVVRRLGTERCAEVMGDQIYWDEEEGNWVCECPEHASFWGGLAHLQDTVRYSPAKQKCNTLSEAMLCLQHVQ